MATPGRPQRSATPRCTERWPPGQPHPRSPRPGSPPAACEPLAVDVSTTLRSLVDGPTRPGRVIAAFPGAVYVAVTAPVTVVALVAPSAVRLPNAAVVRPPAPPRSQWPLVGAAARIGGGELAVDRLVARPAGWWDPVPRLGSRSRAQLEAGLREVGRHVPPWPGAATPSAATLHRAAAALEAALTLGDLRAHGGDHGSGCHLCAPVRRLVGLGAGLTPSGDDVLSGATAGLQLLGAALTTPAAVEAGTRLARCATTWRARTTEISAALLQQAAQAAVAEPVAGVLHALVGRGVAAEAVRRLLAVGHSSGHDLAAGLLLGARVVIVHAARDLRR